MEKKVSLLVLLFLLFFASITFAHSGRTDSNGGHNCSEKSIAKGLCSGYHYHNGGGGSGGSSQTPTSQSYDKDCTDFATYDEVVSYWNAKGYSATNDPENLDGWGNGQVDDGIPCEAPSGYDKTNINNSPEQVQYKQDQQDIVSGENQGYEQGLKDGYLEAEKNTDSISGSTVFKQGYAAGYNKGYDEGKKKIETEKIKVNNEGYAFGQKQDDLKIPDIYNSNPILMKSFEDGFRKAVTERVEAKKKEFENLGYNDGKKDINTSPTDVEEIYINAYKEGYDRAQAELEKEYTAQGYEAAFTMLEYDSPNLQNEKFINWYKEGFESNKEVTTIKEEALALGKDGSAMKIPKQFKKGQKIFQHYYEIGYKEYEMEQNAQQKATAGGVGAIVVGWIGRRFYVAKRMIG